MNLSIRPSIFLANTHGQLLSQHLFAVGYLAYQIIEKLNINHHSLAKSAFIAGILHDIGKLDPQFQEWVIKKHNKKQKIDVPDDGFHIDEGNFTFENHPRHNEISWLLANSLLRDEESLNQSQLNLIYHAIYWHHTRPYRGIDKDFLAGDIEAGILLSLDNINIQLPIVLDEIKELSLLFSSETVNLTDFIPDFNFQYQLTDNDIPDYKEFHFNKRINSLTVKDIASTLKNNAENNLIRMAVINADRMISQLSNEQLLEHLDNKSLITILDEILYLDNQLLSKEIKKCLTGFEQRNPNSERNHKQSQTAQQLADLPKEVYFDDDYEPFDDGCIAVLQGPAGCGKTKITLEWALKTEAKQIIWICPRVQVCLGILQDLTQDEYLKNCRIEIFTGEYKKILSNGQSFDEVETTQPEHYFSGDVVITTIDQIVNHIISHQKITGLLKFMQSHIVFDEFHELIVQPALNLLFAELIEMKKYQKQYANTLLVSATPNYYFLEQVLNLGNSDIIKMDSFNTADYHIKFQVYDETCEHNPITHQIFDDKQKTFVISNTAQDAQIGFLLNQNKENGILLHSKYTRQDKANLFNQVFECFKQNGNSNYDILRSGPIVQASLNISCERMLTDMTSAENWLQRLGRLDRFNQNTTKNIYTTIVPQSAEQGKLSNKTRFLDNTLCVWHNSLAWLNYLQTHLSENTIVKIQDLYQLYQEFYTDDDNKKAFEQDLTKILQRSVQILKEKLNVPLSHKSNHKDNYVIKMAKVSLRGDSRFVQMAVCEVSRIDDKNDIQFINEYAYPEDTDHSQITIGLTENKDRITGYGKKTKNLVDFMQRNHHNIKPNTKQADNDNILLALARSPQNPIYLSYIPNDLKSIGGSQERHEYAMYYVKSFRHPVGIMSIKVLQDLKADDELAD